MSADLLGTIVASTRRIVEVREARESIDALRARVERSESRPLNQLRAVRTAAGSSREAAGRARNRPS